MNFSIKNRALRIILSLFIGGMTQEFIRMATGKDVKGWLWIGALISYILLSVWIYYKNLNDINLMVKKDEKKQNDNTIIDN